MSYSQLSPQNNSNNSNFCGQYQQNCAGEIPFFLNQSSQSQQPQSAPQPPPYNNIDNSSKNTPEMQMPDASSELPMHDIGSNMPPQQDDTSPSESVDNVASDDSIIKEEEYLKYTSTRKDHMDKETWLLAYNGYRAANTSVTLNEWMDSKCIFYMNKRIESLKKELEKFSPASSSSTSSSKHKHKSGDGSNDKKKSSKSNKSSGRSRSSSSASDAMCKTMKSDTFLPGLRKVVCAYFAAFQEVKAKEIVGRLDADAIMKLWLFKKYSECFVNDLKKVNVKYVLNVKDKKFIESIEDPALKAIAEGFDVIRVSNLSKCYPIIAGKERKHVEKVIGPDGGSFSKVFTLGSEILEVLKKDIENDIKKYTESGEHVKGIKKEVGFKKMKKCLEVDESVSFTTVRCPKDSEKKLKEDLGTNLFWISLPTKKGEIIVTYKGSTTEHLKAMFGSLTNLIGGPKTKITSKKNLTYVTFSLDKGVEEKDVVDIFKEKSGVSPIWFRMLSGKEGNFVVAAVSKNEDKE